MRIVRGIAWGAILLSLTYGCRSNGPVLPESAVPASEADFKSVPELKDVMEGMVEGFAETLWSVADEEKIPKDDEEWEKLDSATVGLVETFKFLQISDLAKDKGRWQQHSQKLVETAQLMRTEVKQKDVDAVLQTGYVLYDVCSECHKEYYPVSERPEGDVTVVPGV